MKEGRKKRRKKKERKKDGRKKGRKGGSKKERKKGRKEKEKRHGASNHSETPEKGGGGKGVEMLRQVDAAVKVIGIKLSRDEIIPRRKDGRQNPDV
ncbi:hypothetical protein EYF80_051215 [Liparis tanakae]|uniref:Uncharacterized protein n=1 Tax=Liparis tanakae TaxID=230148 RepID=A0A4Z2FCX4_9TELE|nr:hypothetical protein EYF80_051215 [Liparis tanakae]